MKVPGLQLANVVLEHKQLIECRTEQITAPYGRQPIGLESTFWTNKYPQNQPTLVNFESR